MAQRKYVPISEEELSDRIWDLRTYELKELLAPDLKVEFYWENTDCGHGYPWSKRFLGYHTLGDLTFCGYCVGGDWEIPVYFIVYWDGKKLRAYIPTDGNAWNTDTKKAYGNADGDDVSNADIKNARKRYPELFAKHTIDDIHRISRYDICDYDKMIADIQSRFVKAQ